MIDSHLKWLAENPSELDKTPEVDSLLDPPEFQPNQFEIDKMIQ